MRSQPHIRRAVTSRRRIAEMAPRSIWSGRWAVWRTAPVHRKLGPMHASLPALATERAADNVLYDSGCDLVEAAAAIARVAGAPDGARAMPAVLGCIEAALQELLVAATAMEATTARSTTSCGAVPRAQVVEARMHRGFANLQRALDDAKGAAGAARSLTSRALETAGALDRHRAP